MGESPLFVSTLHTISKKLAASTEKPSNSPIMKIMNLLQERGNLKHTHYTDTAR